MNLSLPFFDDPVPPPSGRAAAAAAVPADEPGERTTPPLFLPSPEALHPAVWRAHQLGHGVQGVTPSGFAALDAELPGGGWPHRVLTELLLPHPGLGELRLLAPALAALARSGLSAGTQAGAEAGGPRCVMLFDPPAGLYAQALAELGVDARPWLVVRGRAPHGRPTPMPAEPGRPTPMPAERGRPAPARPHPLRQWLPSADVLWALEQALKSGHVAAVLAWLPASLKADALRRLQLAAQAHDGPVFVFREGEARQRPSAAPLRLLLQAGGFDELSLRMLKRRGPPLAQPLRLALPPVLSPGLHERGLQRQALQQAQQAAAAGVAVRHAAR
ncbi:MAG: hypothetical protein HY855_13600 [Burkholderiales bacterium]|nr:hypothetical protein [Burkholderiales bacterium]